MHNVHVQYSTCILIIQQQNGCPYILENWDAWISNHITTLTIESGELTISSPF